MADWLVAAMAPSLPDSALSVVVGETLPRTVSQTKPAVRKHRGKVSPGMWGTGVSEKTFILVNFA